MNSRDVPIAKPCNVDWQSMKPTDKGRFCDQCQKVVRDLSKLRERDARALLAQPRNAELCIRYYANANGDIFFGGDRQIVPASLLSRAKRAAAAMALPLGLAACSSPDDAATTKHVDQAQIDMPNDYAPMMGGAPEMPYETPDAASDGGPSTDTDSGAGDTDAGDIDGGEAPHT